MAYCDASTDNWCMTLCDALYNRLGGIFRLHLPRRGKAAGRVLSCGGVYCCACPCVCERARAHTGGADTRAWTQALKILEMAQKWKKQKTDESA